MNLISIEKLIEKEMWWIKPDKELHEAFPELNERDGQWAGYTRPLHAIRGALLLIWLQWHQGIRYTEIIKTINALIKRSVKANKDPKAYQSMREEHDNFLIQLAVITGSRECMFNVSESVIEADLKLDEYQYLQAWTGILKYRILDDQNKVVEQYDLMKKWKSTRTFLWPLSGLVETFVQKDYKSFNTVLKRSCERQWKWSEKDHALKKISDNEMTLDVSKRHPHFLWPWVECAFAKLAFIDGAEIKYDSPWLPLDLVKATMKN